MTPDIARNERDKLASQARFLKIILIWLLGIITIETGLIMFMIINQVTHIVPPEIRHSYQIGAHYANRDYFLDMGSYALDRLLNTTPETVEYNNGVILKMADPAGYAALKTILDAAALKIKKEQISTTWIPERAEFNEDLKQVKIGGKRKVFLAGHLASTQDQVYVIDFNITLFGRLYVVKIAEFVKPESGVKQ